MAAKKGAAAVCQAKGVESAVACLAGPAEAVSVLGAKKDTSGGACRAICRADCADAATGGIEGRCHNYDTKGPTTSGDRLGHAGTGAAAGPSKSL